MNIYMTQKEVSWIYNNKIIKVTKDNIIGIKDVPSDNVVMIIYEENSEHPIMEGINYNGISRFVYYSSDQAGVSEFVEHPKLKNSILGWLKDKDGYIEYYFDVNPNTGELTKYCRAY